MAHNFLEPFPLKDPGSDFIMETHPHLWLEIAFRGSEAFP